MRDSGTGFELPHESDAEETGAGVDAGAALDRATFGSVRRGYDPEEVDTFLAHVADSIQLLQTRSRHAARQVPGDTTVDVDQRFAKMLALQEREADAVVTEAHLEAANILTEAKKEAERIRIDGREAAGRATDEADRFLHGAKEEADERRSRAAEQRTALGETFPQIRERLLTFLEDMETGLDALQHSPGESGEGAGDPSDQRIDLS